MRRFIVLLAVLTYTPAVLASEPEADQGAEPRENSGFVKHSGYYVAPTAGVTTVDGEGTAEFGLRGAWLINRRFGIGLGAVGWAKGAELGGRNLNGGYGGVMLQGVFASESFLHATTQTIIGGGAYCLRTDSAGQNDCQSQYGFFTTDSTLNLEMNVNQNLRVTLGGGYRFVLAGDDSPISSQDLRGFVARTSFEFGEF
jgi:hypothetical protein